jgi:hypothetical protein
MTVEYQSVAYPVVELTLPKWGVVKISTIDLCEKLIDQSGNPLSEEAEEIDDDIFFYVSSKEIKLPIDQLAKIVLADIL